ncbi:hypothetical protein N656DRAFT_615298 [Canariomyces notabilis]|uniref:Uncharacterized protein n=1 Tax=Canariomyces notabilis TaxID=2074819 RepID=A0AAN6YT61_9PEZI|nr:hypothetical protein N656DRAFT_615298 [Canariomyces arenarius]
MGRRCLIPHCSWPCCFTQPSRLCLFRADNEADQGCILGHSIYAGRHGPSKAHSTTHPLCPSIKRHQILLASSPRAGFFLHADSLLQTVCLGVATCHGIPWTVARDEIDISAPKVMVRWRAQIEWPMPRSIISTQASQSRPFLV